MEMEEEVSKAGRAIKLGLEDFVKNAITGKNRGQE